MDENGCALHIWYGIYLRFSRNHHKRIEAQNETDTASWAAQRYPLHASHAHIRPSHEHIGAFRRITRTMIISMCLFTILISSICVRPK